jgi:hypothetical protein
MKNATLSLFAALFTSFAFMGQTYASDLSPYYMAGYNSTSSEFAFPNELFFVFALGKTFLQEPPTSKPFKEAFENLKLYCFGLNHKEQATKAWKARQCFVEAEDLATAIQRLGEFLTTQPKEADSREFGAFENFFSMMSPILTVTPSEDSPLYKKAFELGTSTLSSLVSFTQKDALLISLMDEMKKWTDFIFSEKENTKDVLSRMANAYRGLQKSISAFPLQEKIAGMQPHAALFATYLYKMMHFFVELPVTAPCLTLAEAERQFGQLLIEFGTELRKLS